MSPKSKTILSITVLVFLLTIVITFINHNISLKSTRVQLKNQSIPLTINNIYTVVQKTIIEPYLISSFVANDILLHKLLSGDEGNEKEISLYLNNLQKSHNVSTIFLVEDSTKNYYTDQGLIDKISEAKPENKWYYEFKTFSEDHKINMDYNQNISNKINLFINHKITNLKGEYLGVSGSAIEVAHIINILKDFRVNHNFIISFVDPDGKIILAENFIKKLKHIDNIEILAQNKDKLLKRFSEFIEYSKNNSYQVIASKYIPELNIFLLVNANVNNFTESINEMFYVNILISILISLIISFIILYLIKGYSKKLEYLSDKDSLTSISNRRSFEKNLEQQLLLHKRKKDALALIFIDIDNFKYINDTFGHNKGDEVLKRTAKVLQETIRTSDLIARWGGEEFIITLLDVNPNELEGFAQKIKNNLATDSDLEKTLGYQVTASFGISILTENDTMHTLIKRADELMYKAKKSGKNCYFID